MPSRRNGPAASPSRPRLYLVAQGPDLDVRLKEALGPNADIAAVLLWLPSSIAERELVALAKSAAPIVQPRGAALLLQGHAELVGRSGADGAHLTGYQALAADLPRLKPDRIAGAGGLHTRHDAMQAGEAGADYVMFGEPDLAGHRPSLAAVVERVAWWSEIFEPPCVGFAGDLDEVAALAEAGADFIALGDFVWNHADGSAAALMAASQRLARLELA